MTEQETRWRVLREKLADVRLGGVSPPYVREVCDDVMAHCASLEQQVAEMTKHAQVNALNLASMATFTDQVKARADAADGQLVKMREQVDVWRSRAHQLRTTAPVSAFDEQQADAYEVCADEVSALIDGHTEEAGEAAGARLAAAEAQLGKMREQLRKLPRYWSRVATTPQVRSVPSVLWVDVERVLSALLDPQDQP